MNWQTWAVTTDGYSRRRAMAMAISALAGEGWTVRAGLIWWHLIPASPAAPHARALTWPRLVRRLVAAEVGSAGNGELRAGSGRP